MKPFWYIIANPTAAGGSMQQKWPQIEAVLQELGFSYTIQFTEHQGHAIRLVDDAVLNGHRYIMGIGGDGTNHEMVNGLLRQTAAPSTDITYALLPFGTGNDWARQYGFSGKIRQRLQQIDQQCATPQRQDVGRITFPTGEQRYFANVAGMAYDGFVARRMDEDGKKESRIEYLLAVARYLFEYQLVTANIRYDETVVTDQFYTINVGICKYSGGGMQFVPQAVPDDGLLALTYARRMPKWEVLLQTAKFYNGTLLSHPKLTGVSVRQVEVTGEIDIEADGEYLGKTPATIDILDKQLVFC